jgi:hypothetical protein
MADAVSDPNCASIFSSGIYYDDLIGFGIGYLYSWGYLKCINEKT